MSKLTDKKLTDKKLIDKKLTDKYKIRYDSRNYIKYRIRIKIYECNHCGNIIDKENIDKHYMSSKCLRFRRKSFYEKIHT